MHFSKEFINVKKIIADSNSQNFEIEEIELSIHQMLQIGPWKEVQSSVLALLLDDDQTLWQETINYIYYFQNRGYKFDSTKTIALLYNCLTLSDELDENLIWTITKEIKSVDYSSDYDPFQDEEVLVEMGKIKAMRKILN